ncbi:hypothetical protein G9A89_002008 [Geosiphon pyriformis]|nr:hypothetical protein G9A89_002008 [Geosiphon pyriformis]
MNDYVQGILCQTLIGKKKFVDSELDALFKNSAGPSKLPPINLKEISSQPALVEKTELKINEDIRKNINNVSSGPISASPHTKMKSQGKKSISSIEEKYETKLAKSQINSYLKSGSTASEADETKSHKEQKKYLKRKLSKPLTNGLEKKLKVSETKVVKKSLRENYIEQNDEESSTENDSINTKEKYNEMRNDQPNATEFEPKDMKVDSNESQRNFEDDERLERTVFVGNLPVSVISKVDYKFLKKKFSQFGHIDSIRFRSIAFSEPLPRKVAFKLGKLHAERDILNGYIVFREKASAVKALSMNAQIFLSKHLRVDSVLGSKSYDRKRTIFIGALSFDAQEEELWKHFKNCGDIECVRIVRDKKTNIGKGFAYVQFKERASVGLALKLHETKMGDRKIRVTRYANPKQSTHPSQSGVKIRKGDPKAQKGIMEGAHAVKNLKRPRIRARTRAWKASQKK